MSVQLQQSFVGSIMREPQEPLNWLAYADWLEEHTGNLPLAAAYRWLGRRGKWPHQRTHYRNGHSVPEKYGWGFYRASINLQRYPRGDPPVPAHACLPRSLFVAMAAGAPHRYFLCWNDAIDCVAKGLAELREAASDG